MLSQSRRERLMRRRNPDDPGRIAIALALTLDQSRQKELYFSEPGGAWSQPGGA